MSKIIVVIVLLFVAAYYIVIPYWTGAEAEQQFVHFNQAFYPIMNLKPVESTYERGWFHSYAQSTVEMVPEVFGTAWQNHRLVLLHEIDHGLLPIQSASIYTSLRTVPTLSVESNDESDEIQLLEIKTILQANGDSVSTLTMPALVIQNGNNSWQWQGLKGQVFVKHDFATVEMDLQSPQIRLDTEHSPLLIQNLSFQANMQPGEDSMQGVGTLAIASLQTMSKPGVPLQLKQIQLVVNNHVVNDNLTAAMETTVQQVHLGTEEYGPGVGQIELQNWSVSALNRIQNKLMEIQEPLAISLKNPLIMFQLMPYGLALLSNSPEFAITRLTLNTPEGDLHGKMRVKMAPIEANVLTLFNPAVLLKALDAQLEIHIPQPLLNHLTEESEFFNTTTQSLFKPGVKTILGEIFTPTEDNYYQAHLQLTEGRLQVNQRTLPQESWWPF